MRKRRQGEGVEGKRRKSDQFQYQLQQKGEYYQSHYIPESVGSNSNNALWTLLRGEARGKVKDIVRERREVEARLIGIAQPGPAGDSQDTLRGMHLHTKQLHWPCTKVPAM